MPETRNYQSQLELGKRYRDRATGFEGKCVAVAFFEHGCERCTLKGMDLQGRIVDYGFDAPEVELIVEVSGRGPIRHGGERVELVEEKTGGPHGSAPMRRR